MAANGFRLPISRTMVQLTFSKILPASAQPPVQALPIPSPMCAWLLMDHMPANMLPVVQRTDVDTLVS